MKRDPRAFRKAELPLLCAFCEAVCLNRYYGRALAEESTEDFDRFTSRLG